MPPRSKAGAVLVGVACAVVVALSLAGGVAGAAQVGVNVAPTSGDFFVAGPVQRAIARLHPGWVRVFMGWNALEPAPGVYDEARLRNYRLFFASLPAGTRVDVDIEGTPAWASGSSSIAAPPRDDGAFGAFVSHVAAAFRGTVAAYEIGDEEDTPAYWGGTVAQYAALLRTAYTAIKAVDPAIEVLTGGLAGNDYQFINALYGAGARGSFDAVGVHTDNACNVTAPSVFAFDRGTRVVNRYYFLGFTSVHAVMAAHGDGAKPIVMTEIGWSSTTATCTEGAWAGRKPAGVTPAVQAAFLTSAYRCLALTRYSYVQAALWFDLFDHGTTAAMNDNYGLLTSSIAPKPAFAAFAAAARRSGRLAGSCGAPPRHRRARLRPP